MKIETTDAGPAKRILAAMITDTAALGRIAAHWPADGPGLFAGRWENIVGGWAAKYYRRYGRAPGREIESLYARWAADTRDRDTAKLVESFLGVLSNEYETRGAENTDYIVDLAANHFNRCRMATLADEIRNEIAAGKDARAAEKIAAFHRLELGVGAGVDVIRDRDSLRAALAEPEDDLFSYDAGLKHFFRGMLARDVFIAFQAPMKRTKSFWLIDAAWRAMQQKCRVAFFAVGDMSEKQMMRRFACRAAGRPRRKKTGVKYPTFLEVPEGGKMASVTHKTGDFNHDLDYKTARRAMKKIMGGIGDDAVYLRLAVYPTRGINVPGIAAALEGWERQGWQADVVVLDYIDLLAPIAEKDRIHQIDETWGAARGLAQTRHCLVITATQANAAAARTELIDERNFSGNQLKMAHVTGMIGINMTHKEKRAGLCRLNWIQRREGEFDVERVCHCAGCLDIAQPAIKSIF